MSVKFLIIKSFVYEYEMISWFSQDKWLLSLIQIPVPPWWEQVETYSTIFYAFVWSEKHFSDCKKKKKENKTCMSEVFPYCNPWGFNPSTLEYW